MLSGSAGKATSIGAERNQLTVQRDQTRGLEFNDILNVSRPY